MKSYPFPSQAVCEWLQIDVSQVGPGQTFNTETHSVHPQIRYLSHASDPITCRWPGSVFVYSCLKVLTLHSAVILSCQCSKRYLLWVFSYTFFLFFLLPLPLLSWLNTQQLTSLFLLIFSSLSLTPRNPLLCLFVSWPWYILNLCASFLGLGRGKMQWFV